MAGLVKENIILGDSTLNDELMLKELERRDGIYSFIFHELEASKGGADLSDTDNQTICAAAPSVTPQPVEDRPTTSVACKADKPEFFKPWLPPQPKAPFVNSLSSPKSPLLNSFGCAYSPNYDFRVKTPPPRFSHVTVPLVRNRKHDLKESASYRSSGRNAAQIPDLRELFPLDPDAVAPFGYESKSIAFKSATTVSADN